MLVGGITKTTKNWNWRIKQQQQLTNSIATIQQKKIKAKPVRKNHETTTAAAAAANKKKWNFIYREKKSMKIQTIRRGLVCFFASNIKIDRKN